MYAPFSSQSDSLTNSRQFVRRAPGGQNVAAQLGRSRVEQVCEYNIVKGGCRPFPHSKRKKE
jgi:hypothetical protein